MIVPGIVCHANLTAADVGDLERFAGGGAGLVVDALATETRNPEPETRNLTQSVQSLFRAGVSVRWWRFDEDPRDLAGWPGRFVQLAPIGCFGHLPDLHGLPTWYPRACQMWQNAGGVLAEPVYKDEANRLLGFHCGPYSGRPWRYDVVFARAKRGDFRNLAAAAARARHSGQRVILAGYSRPGEQQRCLQDLAQASVSVETYLYAYRPPVDTGLALAGLELARPDQPASWRRSA